MKKVFSYLRFSTPEQSQGDSERRQLEYTESWADRNGHVLDVSLSLKDLGVSAFRGKNASEGSALGDFLEFTRTGKVESGDILVVENLDRLTRLNSWDAVNLLRPIIDAGVEIVTLEPERSITREELISPMGYMKLMEMILNLTRGHEESRMKSERLKESWKAKRAIAGERPLSSQCPHWLKAMKDAKGKVSGFEPMPERVKIVKKMYRMASEGMGIGMIAKSFNRKDIPTWGRSTMWQRSYVIKVLRNRNVLGEYQPHRMEEGKRVPIGEPILDYYPTILSEGEFYSAQEINAKTSQRGRHANRVSNLFTGILKDARDGTSMIMIDKSSKKFPEKSNGVGLVSSGANVGKKDSVYFAFPYEHFERSLLVWAYDLKLDDILPKKATNVEKELANAKGRLKGLNEKIEKVQARMSKGKKFDSLFELLEKLDTERAEEKRKFERLQRESTNQSSDSLGSMKELIVRLKKAKKDERFQLRTKLRSVLRRVVKDIVVYVVEVNRDRVAIVDVELQSGERRRFEISSGTRVVVPEHLKKLDIRKWKQWSKSDKAKKFQIITERIQRMIDLEESGYSRTEIAKEFGCQVSHISKTLIRYGRKKVNQKNRSHKWLMSWYASQNRWGKGHSGNRYIVSLGKLSELYPELFKNRTANGSWKAANRWWEDKLKELQIH